MTTIDLTKAGERVRAWRKFLDPPVSLQQLAEALGQHRETLARKERGRARFDTDELAAVAAILRISHEELLGPTPAEVADARRRELRLHGR